jgi:hypothetical protein
MPARNVIVATQRIERAILLIRGQKVILDADLAVLYGVPGALIQAVKRNLVRFPSDFMVQLTRAEAVALRSQTVNLERGRGKHRKYLPYAFTQEGVAMLSSVLRSSRAVQVNIAIMRVFVRLRGMLASNEALARKLDALEKKYDGQFRAVFDAIRRLMSAPAAGRRTIGFRPRPGEDSVSRLRPHRG